MAAKRGLGALDVGLWIAGMMGMMLSWSEVHPALGIMVGVSTFAFIGLRVRLAAGDASGLDDGAAARLAELEQRLGDLEHGQQRLQELEERLDFAERMLARPDVREEMR